MNAWEAGAAVACRMYISTHITYTYIHTYIHTYIRTYPGRGCRSVKARARARTAQLFCFDLVRGVGPSVSHLTQVGWSVVEIGVSSRWNNPSVLTGRQREREADSQRQRRHQPQPRWEEEASPPCPPPAAAAAHPAAAAGLLAWACLCRALLLAGAAVWAMRRRRRRLQSVTAMRSIGMGGRVPCCFDESGGVREAMWERMWCRVVGMGGWSNPLLQLTADC